jgi:OOP family OmpA-OmpF porin
MKKIYAIVPIVKKMVPVLFLSVLLLPWPARSEIKAGSFEMTPFAGYNFFENRQNLENSPLFGGRLGYNFLNNFGTEATWEMSPSRVDNKSANFTKEGQFTSPIDKVRVSFYHLDLVYHFMPEGAFNPFVVAGYGAAHYHPEEINNKNLSVVDFGVGAKYWLSKHIALRLDLRDNLVCDELISNIGATFGVVFALGGKKTPAPTPVEKIELLPEPKPKVIAPVVVLVAEPKAVEKVIVLASEPEEKVVVLALEDIHFDFDQSALKTEARTILKRNLLLLKENPKARIRIAGYTSASGTEEYNQQLSERRARAVENYLIQEGVATPDRLSMIGYGESNPDRYETAPQDLYSTAAKANMRVLFEIVVK